ncbi:MAG: hypothetical protein Q8J64_07400 [Thermodesulfovibrionales bacterium]|nr:hypothetical protein [Thermodesulfovibrionales bacterium]
MVLNTVAPHETLARYIYSKHHYRSSDHTVKYAAFVPPKDNRRLSIFRISSLPENEIWAIGKNLRQQSLLGRADIKALDVFQIGLSIDPDNTPPHHANITDWPSEDSAIKLKAIELAEKARFYIK